MKYYEAEMTTNNPENCVAMTWEDAMEMEKLNQENGWGLSASDCLRMLADHMDAEFIHHTDTDPTNVMNAIRTVEKIEWRLEDANFHTFCGFLHDCEYEKAINWLKKDYADSFEGRF